MLCSLFTAAGHTQISRQAQQAPLTSIHKLPDSHNKLPQPPHPTSRHHNAPILPSSTRIARCSTPSPPRHQKVCFLTQHGSLRRPSTSSLPTRKVIFLTQKRPFATPHFPHRPQQEITRFAKGNVLRSETIGFARQNVTFRQPKRMVLQRSPKRASPRMCPNASKNTYIHTQRTT